MSDKAGITPGRPEGARPAQDVNRERENAAAKLRDAIASQGQVPLTVEKTDKVIEPQPPFEPREETTPRGSSGEILGSEYERLDLPSGFMPYEWTDLSVRRFNWKDQAKLARAIRGRSMSLVLDVLSSTCNRDVREFAIEDWKALCVWHRLNSYMHTSVKTTFRSKYGNVVQAEIKKTKVVMTPPTRTRAEYLEAFNRGFALPTVRDLETTGSFDLDPDTSYLFEKAWYVNIQGRESRIEELAKAGDRTPSITARIERMQELDGGQGFAIFDEIDKFATDFDNFSVVEMATIPNDKFDAAKAVEALMASGEQADMEEASQIQAAIDASVPYTPAPEEVPLVFNLWHLFPYC